MILGDARAPRPAGPATNPEERIGAPVPTGQGAHPSQVVSDQFPEERRQADAALQGQSLQPAELNCIEFEVRRHPGRHRHNHSVTSARADQGCLRQREPAEVWLVIEPKDSREDRSRVMPRNGDTSTVTVPAIPYV